jgi:hypothetical protein
LPQIGPARLVELLQFAGRVRIADLGELRVDRPPAALEDAEHVAGRHGLPRRQRHQLWLDAMPPARFRVRRLRVDDRGRLAVMRIGFADDRVLERQDAVVVGAGRPEHRGRRHQAALGRGDDRHMASAARLARDAVVARVEEADELGRFLVEQRVGARRLDAGGIVPRFREARLDMRGVEHAAVFGAVGRRAGRQERRGVAAMAIGAAEDDAGARMHGQRVGRRVAAHAAGAFELGLGLRSAFCGAGGALSA